MNHDELALSIEALNEYAKQSNSPFVRPELTDNLKVCRHGITIKIPSLADGWRIYHLATAYLSYYMEIAAHNDGLDIKNLAFREVGVFWRIDSDCNARTEFCEIKMQVYIKS